LNNWATLGVLLFLSYFLVGQFGKIVFAKFSFDKVVAMSDTASLLVTTHFRWKGVKVSLGNVI